MEADRFLTYSLRDARLTRILAAAINAVEPGKIVRQHLLKTTLPPHDRLYLLGIGKAAEPMTIAAAGLLERFESALIITKKTLGNIEDLSSSKVRARITIMEAGHPIPDERSLAAGGAVLDFVSRLTEHDLLVCLISGGGSALVSAPRHGVSLSDAQALTASMLDRGATIEELNALRRQIDFLKGGGLVQATRARVISLILSDVIGDDLATIASGLTTYGSGNNAQALSILKKYGMEGQVSNTTLNLIAKRPISDAAKSERVQNIIVGNNNLAAQGAKKQVQMEGLSAEIIDTDLHGEARLIGRQLAELLQTRVQQNRHPFCLISGGETTVTIQANGKGGRNQELALAAVETLNHSQNALLVALATDGNDGPTDAAGAVVTGETFRRSRELGLDSVEYLARNDSYVFFDTLGDLLKPGYTGTNVNDLIFLFGL
jgi:glycerate 2-kinase